MLLYRYKHQIIHSINVENGSWGSNIMEIFEVEDE